MDIETTLPARFAAPRVLRTLLVADIVESVRLFERNESETLAHWMKIFSQVEREVVPAFGGRLVKSLGDGVLLEFEQVPAAVSAAFAIQRLCHRDNVGRPADDQILLRIGIEIGDVLVTEHDVFGHGVNLAARLCTLAGPGEVVASVRVREQLTLTLDADIEDLGECYLKHIQNPVRAYRIGPPGPRPVIAAHAMSGDLRPSIAIVPFVTREPASGAELAGDVLAEELIRALSATPDLNVIARLSTAPFRERPSLLSDASDHLRADYVLSGSYVADGATITAQVEFADAKSGRIIWMGSLGDRLQNLAQGDSELVARILSEVRAAVMVRELQRVRSHSVPNLKSYSLMIAAIALMHRMSMREFDQAQHLLQSVIDRGRRQALPQAWLAQWFVLRMQQGWSPDPKRDFYHALECSKQALDADPDCSLALAVDGLVQTHFLKRVDRAEASYRLAVEKNPNDPLAWVLKGTLHAFKGEGRSAVDNTQRALRLSPLDPHQYYYDSLSGTACLAAKDYEGALRHAHRSLRANRSHTSTLRVATIAAWRLDRHEEAREFARKLLKMEPGLTIGGYLARSPAAPFASGKDWSEALRQAGVPN